jgi:hypothetical protein
MNLGERVAGNSESSGSGFDSQLVHHLRKNKLSKHTLSVFFGGLWSLLAVHPHHTSLLVHGGGHVDRVVYVSKGESFGGGGEPIVAAL